MTLASGRKDYLAAADVLRVACIGLIAWYHIWQQSWLDPGFQVGSVYIDLQRMVRDGYMMVDVLLVLSGFLLAIPYARSRQEHTPAPKALDFYKKRFWRIYPCYAAALLLTLFCWALPTGQYSSAGAMLKDLVTHLTFTHTFFYDTYIGTKMPVVLWTVGVEVQFYVLFPLIALAYRERPGCTCLFLSAIAWGFRMWVYQMSSLNMWVNQLPCMLDLFACGMAAAWAYVKIRDRPRKRWTSLVMAVGMLLCFCVLMQIMYVQTLGTTVEVDRGQLFWRLPIGIMSGLFLLCGGLIPTGLARVLGNPVTRFLSSITYNFYIWHQFLAVELKELHIPAYTAELPNQAGEQPWQIRYTLLCFFAAAAVATVFTFLIEKPFVRFFRKRSQARPELASGTEEPPAAGP